MSPEPPPTAPGTTPIFEPRPFNVTSMPWFISKPTSPADGALVDGNHPSSPSRRNRLPSRRPVAGRQIGLGAFALVIALMLCETVALAVANGQHWFLATVLAWVVIVLTLASFSIGIIAMVRRSGRRFGTVAVVLSIGSNPLVLVSLFAALGGR